MLASGEETARLRGWLQRRLRAAGLVLAATAGAAATRPLRPRLHRRERRPLLPDAEPRRAGALLRRGAARRRRHPAGNGQRAVPDDRDAARLRRQQDQLRVDLAGRPGARRGRRRLDDLPLQQRLLRPQRLRGRQLHRPRLRQLLRRRPLGGDHAGPCGDGYIRLADSRYEARDTQYLLGLLADEGLVAAARRSASPASPTAAARAWSWPSSPTRSACPNGKLAPWRSPTGKRMRIAAAYPRWPWSDLVSALIPNGRYLDNRVAPLEQSLKPFGVPISSYLNGLYLSGVLNGYYCGGAPASTPCTDAQANVTQDKAFIDAGQPLPAEARTALKGIYRYNGGYPLRFVKGASTPAPLLIQSGWTDELFPPEQALRVYGYLRSRNRRAPGQPAARRPRPQPRLQQARPQPPLQQPGRALLRLPPARRPQRASRRPAGSPPSPRPARSATPDGGPFRAKGLGRAAPGALPASAPRRSQEFTSAGGDPARRQRLRPDLRHHRSLQDDPGHRRAQRRRLLAPGQAAASRCSDCRR